MRYSLLRRVALTLAVAGTATLFGGATASANQYSVAYSPTGTYLGIFGSWHDNNMYVTDSNSLTGSHINSEMWMPTNSTESNYVETGLRNGYDAANPCATGANPNCVAYEVFWDDNIGSNQYEHWVRNLTPDGGNHSYEILRNSTHSTWWDVYYDYNLVGTSTLTGNTTAVQAQGGGEDDTYNFATSHADTFDMYFQTLSTSGTWSYWPSQGSFVTQPCGRYSQGNCLNGVAYHPYEWSWNKP